MGDWSTFSGTLIDKEFPCVTAFFDESGHSASTRAVAIGGAMATPKRWRALREKWTNILEKFSVGTFHMTDFENRKGEFLDWDENRRRRMLAELFDAIEESPLILIGAAVVVEDFNRLDAAIRRRLIDPWYLCYRSCFEEVLTVGYLVDPLEEDIEPECSGVRACFYEEHRQYKYGPAIFRLAQESAEVPGSRRAVGIVGWGTKGSSVHFQLADLVAYELRKHVENSVFRQGRPTRWPMKRLLKTVFVANIFTGSDTSVCMDEGQFVMFRHGSLADMRAGDVVRLVARPKPERFEQNRLGQ